MTKKVDYLRDLIRDMDNAEPQVLLPGRAAISFELSSDSALLTGLSGWLGAFTVRAMLSKLKVDEHYIFKWRPENKYIQHCILNYYAPGCMPKTIGLSPLLKQDNWVPRIRKLIGSGYFIKATLGFGSGRTKSFDRTSEIEQILNDHEEQSASNEKWIIQKKLKLHQEYRVHSFGKELLYGMTFRTSGMAQQGDLEEPQEFIRLILEKLPAPLLEGTLIGWDIGLSRKGKYYVIEANFTGFHPEFYTGFQTSGYFEEEFCGPIICAWLNAYLRNRYGIAIGAVNDQLILKTPFMGELSYYLSLFRNEHIKAMQKAKGTVAALYIYLGEKTDFLMIKLISFMQIANFAHACYIISPKELQAEAMAIFKGGNIRHLTEQSLFTDSFHRQLLQLDEEKRKQVCLQHALDLIKEKPYLML